MFDALIESYGEAAVAIGGGLLAGAAFGLLAQVTKFCMRSAVIETSRKGPGERFSVWLTGLAVAMIAVQSAAFAGLANVEAVRALAGRGSLSGALAGGLMFGAGMVLARGCVSRLLVLSASGNVRAIATSAVFVLAALATMRGPLAGAREALAGLQTIEGAAHLSLLRLAGAGPVPGAALGLVLLAVALAIGWRKGLSLTNGVFSALLGLAVGGAFVFTSGLNGASFDPQPVQGLSFIAPYANGLAMALGLIGAKPDFTIALIPGVALGALLAALVTGTFRLEVFQSRASILRYGAGAVLMGFGGVVATGCSLGNGVSGLAVFSTTALVALVGMWVGAALTDALIDRAGAERPATAPAFVAAE